MSSFSGSYAAKAVVRENVGLAGCLSSHLAGHHPIERDSHKTDGVLGTIVVRQKTYGNPGMHRQRAASYGGFLIHLKNLQV
jgi:hypothetical protein